MVLKKIISFVGDTLIKVYEWSKNHEKAKQEQEKSNEKKEKEDKNNEKKERMESEHIFSLWDYLSFNENTQAYHLINVIGFDEWVDMEEIRRRIKELFGIDYKNERSLYPYIKTLVDCGLIEGISAGGRRKWRKKELFFSIKKKKKEKKTIAVT